MVNELVQPKWYKDYDPKPSPYDSYKCFICDKTIGMNEMNYWNSMAEKGNQNCHATCADKKFKPDGKSGSSEEKNQVTTISEERKKSLYDHYGGRLGITDTDNDLWDLATLQVEHQQVGGSKVGANIAYKWAGLIEIWKTITKSAEIGEVAYSSQVLNGGNGVSSKGSFHTSSAVKDLGSSRQVATLPIPPFFSDNIRWIAKCVKHGVICNEDDYKCKQCVEEYMDKQFATGGTIDSGLLL